DSDRVESLDASATTGGALPPPPPPPGSHASATTDLACLAASATRLRDACRYTPPGAPPPPPRAAATASSCCVACHPAGPHSFTPLSWTYASAREAVSYRATRGAPADTAAATCGRGVGAGACGGRAVPPRGADVALRGCRASPRRPGPTPG